MLLGSPHADAGYSYLPEPCFAPNLRNSDKLLAELFIPLADAIRADGQKAAPTLKGQIAGVLP